MIIYLYICTSKISVSGKVNIYKIMILENKNCLNQLNEKKKNTVSECDNGIDLTSPR